MKQSLLFGLCLVASVALSATSQAEFITSNGDIQMIAAPSVDQPVSPPLVDITRLSASSGRLFTNQLDGAPFAVGSHIATVGEITIGGAVNGDNNPVQLPDGSTMAAIFGVEGTIVSNDPV